MLQTLIVSGFTNKNGSEKSKEYYKAVKQTFDPIKSQYHIQVAFDEKHISNLDDYLYDQSTDFISKKSQSRFDRLDFIFIDGPCKILP